MSMKGIIVNAVTLKCRGCLVESGEMKNMYEWGLSEDFYKCTDIKVNRSEGLTELLCSGCEVDLKRCKSFRIKCMRSDLMLRDEQRLQHQHDLNDLKDVATLTKTSNKLLTDFTNHVLSANEIIIQLSPVDSERKLNLSCPFDCSKVYTKRKDLASHIVNRHDIGKGVSIKLQYYCPYIDCGYFMDSGKNKFFNERKFLNQHHNKVHAMRKFVCDNCKGSFAKDSDLLYHVKSCGDMYHCDLCNRVYTKKESYLVHLLRKHPELHKDYKENNRGDKRLKRVSETIVSGAKKTKTEDANKNAKVVLDYMCDSPKRSFATQTFNDANFKCSKNDISLANLNSEYSKNADEIDRNFSTIETQTVFEDLLSLKSQNSEDDSLFFSETVTDIQTQTWPVEFGISLLNKETNTSKSPDLIIKETQTCGCILDSPKPSFPRSLFDSISSSPSSVNLTSTQTQTADSSNSTSSRIDVFNTETQTCFEDELDSNSL